MGNSLVTHTEAEATVQIPRVLSQPNTARPLKSVLRTFVLVTSAMHTELATTLVSRYPPVISPELLMPPTKVLNGGACGSLTGVKGPGRPVKEKWLPWRSR